MDIFPILLQLLSVQKRVKCHPGRPPVRRESGDKLSESPQHWSQILHPPVNGERRAEETSERFHMVMKLEFTPALATSTHAAVIKSQSGCLLHKQIASDYSNLSSSDSVKTSLN